MSNILLVISSPRGDASHSTAVARSLVTTLTADDPSATVTVRDLAGDPLPHIGLDFVLGQGMPASARSPAQQAAVALSDALVEELMAADTVVIASPMINFGLASTLKTWFDYLLRAGVTFRYSEKGPEGLVTSRKFYIVEARGGIYSEGPLKAIDFQEPYLRQLLAFIGVTDVEVIAVEGVALGPDAAEQALSAALDRVSVIAAQAA